MDGLDLRRVHGDACRGYDVSQVRDGWRAEGALGTLDEEAVALKFRKHDTEVAEVICP